MATTRKRIGSKKPTATVSSGTIPGENVKNSDPDSSTGSDSVCSYCRFLCLLAVFMVCAFAVYIWCLECPLGELADFDLPPQPKFVGALEPNNILSRGERIFVIELYGPESFAVDRNGDVYTGISDGRICRIVSDEKLEEVTMFRKGHICNGDSSSEELELCSRPLGLHFHPNGLLYVADAYNGLYSVNVTNDVEENKRKQLVWDINTDIIGGERTVLLNNMAFLKNGSILMTDTTMFPLHSFFHDLLVLKPTGKLLLHTPGLKGNTGETHCVKNLHSANGLLLSKDESHVLVAETVKCRILRYYLKGPKAGTWDIFADNLPGMPDNLSFSKRGTIWVALALTRHPITDAVLRNCWIRKLMCKLRFGFFDIVDKLPKYGLILELDTDDGHIVRSYHDPGGEVVEGTSEVVELDKDSIYIGSYSAPYLVRATLDGS